MCDVLDLVILTDTGHHFWKSIHVKIILNFLCQYLNNFGASNCEHCDLQIKYCASLPDRAYPH